MEQTRLENNDTTQKDQVDGSDGFNLSMIAISTLSAHGFSPSDTAFS